MNYWKCPITQLLTALFIACLTIAPAAHAQWLKDQAVTYANFDFVRSVACSMEEVYFATTNGIIVYDKIRQQWQQPLTGADGLDNQAIVRMRVDRFGRRLIAATDAGVFEYNELFGRWSPIDISPQLDNDERHVPPPEWLLPNFGGNYMGGGRFMDAYGRTWNTTDIVDDNAGTLWIGTWGFGPAMASPTSGLMDQLPYGLLQNHVTALLADDSMLWIGGPIVGDFRTGVSGYNRDKNAFFPLESGLSRAFPSADVSCLAADGQRMYIGTSMGVFPVDKNTWQFSRPIDKQRGLPDENIQALAKMGSSLLIGTASGLYASDLSTDSLYTIYAGTFANQAIYDLAPVDSTVWVASSVGAYRYSPQANTLQRYQDSTLVLFGAVYDIEHCGDNTWFVSDGGLVRLNRKTGQSTPFREPAAIASGRALAVNETIAAVTSDNGMTLIFLDRETPFSKEFTDRDGLASNTVYSLLLDGPYVWVGTDRGLTRFLWDNPNRVD
jgi:ligand-binding sensor domain-containing protein